jgi:hypothetical protein
MDQAALDAELEISEGRISYLYDDLDGARLVKGSTIRGVPTLGVGINALFFYPEEIDFLLHNRERRAIEALTAAAPWFASLDDVRQRALVDLYYNVPQFLHWPNFIGFASVQRWTEAAAELENTHPWIDQVGARGHRIAAMLRTGAA